MSYQINENSIKNIINKLNIKSFSELADYAKEELYQVADNQLSLQDCDQLLAQAKKIQAKNNAQYRQQITRQAIPKQSTHLVATQLQTNFSNAKAQQLQYDEAMFYSNDFIPNRDSDFVNQGDIASMFSPAAYLVKLYREAQKLHPVNSPYFIDNRRPD
ncbi:MULTISPECIES: hypothetical protein [unclassified Arsenophonus]|uniref:hypothetical protein n=1 Tax=unclassified Arsenophonus TaxID=2627083 RepID=UPI002856FA23|nr:hypothetical protein [Arsenophonus sp.]MDR5609334.1 hypothetical protein [Arsenophonus sp.]MDR5613066.1 hypothetical protein [Arsenophonus sp.]